MTKTLQVANIRCEGCANSIIKALEDQGFRNVSVDLSCEPRKVTLEVQNEASEALIEEILSKLGYPLADKVLGFTEHTSLKVKSFVSCAVGKMNTKSDVDLHSLYKRGE